MGSPGYKVFTKRTETISVIYEWTLEEVPIFNFFTYDIDIKLMS